MSDRSTQARVLLIEDNEADRRLVEELLAAAPGGLFGVEAVATLSAGIEAGQASTPDAILLDLGLPDAEGMEALRQVHFAVPDVPIVVLTGLDDEQLGLAALQEGAQDYLLKVGLTAQSLRVGVRHAMARKRMVLLEEEIRQLLDQDARKRHAATERVRLAEVSASLLEIVNGAARIEGDSDLPQQARDTAVRIQEQARRIEAALSTAADPNDERTA